MFRRRLLLGEKRKEGEGDPRGMRILLIGAIAFVSIPMMALEGVVNNAVDIVKKPGAWLRARRAASPAL